MKLTNEIKYARITLAPEEQIKSCGCSYKLPGPIGCAF